MSAQQVENSPSSSTPSVDGTAQALEKMSLDSRPDALSSEECSLYVGDLDLKVTEAHLYDLFSQFGQVKSIRVAKDTVTKRSLGYAFVNYNTPEDAEKALNDERSKLLDGKLLRVMKFQRDPALRKHNQSGNVFIKNLDPQITSKDLFDTFSAFGKIGSCKIATDEFGVSRGFGYVLFEDPSAADAAIERMNGMIMNDRQIHVSRHVSKKERLHKLEELRANYTNLYIKNIDANVTEDEFTSLFSQYGKIVSHSLPLNPEGLSRGFGFVNFETHDQAVKAVDNLNDYELHGKKLYVSRAQKKYERMEELRQQSQLHDKSKYQGTNLYIKYLDPAIDDNKLKEAFAPFGTITSAKIMTDDNGQSRGFGFVCYSNPEEAKRAIAEMHQSTLSGNQIYVNLAQRKDANGRNGAVPMGVPPFDPRFKPPMPINPGALPAMAAALRGPPMMPPYYYGFRGMPMQGGPMPGPMVPGGPGGPGGPQGPVGSNGPRYNGKKGHKNNQQQPFGSTLSAAVASAPNPQAEKQIIGEAIYPKVHAHPSVQRDVDLAGKITGMLLDHDNEALLQWIDDEPTLKRHIQQAYEAYMDYLSRSQTKA
uniref:Polyadenylate-binding protein, cytoplasmic and nuclear n=1 Tax=Blastobotrys adeninivorans TaxID=409370 RepID=A0A060TBG3_BLAAD